MSLPSVSAPLPGVLEGLTPGTMRNKPIIKRMSTLHACNYIHVLYCADKYKQCNLCQ